MHGQIKLRAQKLESVLKRIDRKDFLIKALEKEAFRLRREVEKINDRKRKELTQKEYAKLISRMEENQESYSCNAVKV